MGDKERRARFDRGEIDATGAERPDNAYYKTYAGEGPRQQYYSSGGFADFGDESDIFSELFGRAARGGHGRHHHTQAFRGADVQYAFEVNFMDAALGAKRRVTMPDGASLDITVPAGVSDGQTLRLKGKGIAGHGGGPNGDAYVKVTVTPHPYFKRRGRDILLDVPITLDEAVLGGKVTVPTIHGKVAVPVPAGASSGQTLRLKGKGIKPAKGAAGDQLVSLKIVMPAKPDEELKTFMEGWKDKHSYSVRQAFDGE
nr:J domain-containing protein [Kordiimonas marina]